MFRTQKRDRSASEPGDQSACSAADAKWLSQLDTMANFPPSKLEVGLTGSRSATSSLDALPSGLFWWIDSFPSSSPLVLTMAGV
ncbi:hypothetical protein N7540_008510 [Penicillium herquei]|nr:hypothetical protein N7540_008510 [Penicillium herquei]